jgi:UDP-N-acetylmuramoyl-L-alanyl-D-glutamate--2,6-diaminopimelate ligase
MFLQKPPQPAPSPQPASPTATLQRPASPKLPMLLSTLIKHLGPVQTDGPLDREVQRITHDSRDAQPTDLFVAIRGERLDGRRFVRGLAVAAVIADGPVRPDPGVTTISVPNARIALAHAAAALADFPAHTLPVVGITGTNGKTTVCWMLEAIAQAANWKVGVVGTTGHRIGETSFKASHTTPEAPKLQHLLATMRDANCRFAAIEVSSIALALHRADGIPFKVAVFTNLSRDHLDHHGDMDTYLSAKARLFGELMANDGVAVLNLDDPATPQIDSAGKATWTYGQATGADFRYRIIDATLGGSHIFIDSPHGTTELDLPLLGAHNVANAVAAFAAACALGISVDDCVSGLSQLRHIPGRLEPVANPLGIHVLVDYAHTPDALDAVLTSLASLGKRRILTVFGCGGDRDAGKRSQMGVAASRYSDKVFITSDNPRTEDPQAIIADILPGLSGDHAVVIDRETAISTAIQEACAGDIVLIAGKGHERHQIIGQSTHPFDDVQVAMAACRAMELRA